VRKNGDLMADLKRIEKATLIGALLGIPCVLGASLRLGGWMSNEILLFGLWYNRVIMGLLIGLAGNVQLIKKENVSKRVNTIIRGTILGLLVSLQFYLSTNLLDPLTFFAGILYGIIIDLICTSYS